MAGTPGSVLLDSVRDGRRDGSSSTVVVLAYLARDVTVMNSEGMVPDSPSGDDWQDLVLLLSIAMPPDAANDHSNRI